MNGRAVPMQASVPQSALQNAISVVSIPRPAALNMPFESSTNCIMFIETRLVILMTPYFPFPLQTPSSPLPYKIDLVSKGDEDSGLGVFAARNIEAGELIMSERPLVILPGATLYDEDTRSLDRTLSRWFSFLPSDDLAKFKELSNCKGRHADLRGILGTNSLYIGRLPGLYEGAHVGVCHQMSRVYHSCSPNASEFWDFQSFSFQLRATRPISAGSQIFITYMDVRGPRAIRRQELKKNYSFACACASCSFFNGEKDSKNEASKRSDIRRSLLAQHMPNPYDEKGLKKWLEDSSLISSSIIQESLKWIRMMEDEGILLESIWAAHVQRLAKCYCALGDADDAKKWATKAAAWTRATNGTDGEWDAIAQNPRRADWWGLRMANN